MNVKEASKLAGVHEETMRRWLREKKIDSEITSKRTGYSISEESLFDYLARREEWMRLKEPHKKHGKTEYRAETDGTLLIMVIRVVEPKDVKRFIELLDEL